MFRQTFPGCETGSAGEEGLVSDTALIDARNVQRPPWPHPSDEELVERVRTWAERNGKRIVLVFDGKAPGGIVGTTELDERTTLVGSSGETAGGWLIRAAPHYPGAWLVAPGPGLRAAAGGQAERVIGGGGFLRELDGE